MNKQFPAPALCVNAPLPLSSWDSSMCAVRVECRTVVTAGSEMMSAAVIAANGVGVFGDHPIVRSCKIPHPTFFFPHNNNETIFVSKVGVQTGCPGTILENLQEGSALPPYDNLISHRVSVGTVLKYISAGIVFSCVEDNVFNIVSTLTIKHNALTDATPAASSNIHNTVLLLTWLTIGVFLVGISAIAMRYGKTRKGGGISPIRYQDSFHNLIFCDIRGLGIKFYFNLEAVYASLSREKPVAPR